LTCYLKNEIVLEHNKIPKTTCKVLDEEGVKSFSQAYSLAIVDESRGTKVTILNRKQTDQDIFIYETVFAACPALK